MDTKKIHSDTQHKLLENGVDSLEALQALRHSDLVHFQLPLGQLRLLEKILGMGVDNASNVPLLAQSQGANTGDLCNQASSSVPGQSPQSSVLNTDMFLGMGSHGDQKAYHDIVDFLPKRSPYDVSSEGKSVIVQREDGTLFVDQHMSKDKSLDKVTWQQWGEANTLIMSKLMSEGVQPLEYMSYTTMIHQLAQKYDWISVLRFDREYRKKQANTGKKWGSDMPLLRDVTLIPKVALQPFHGSKTTFGKKNDAPSQGQRPPGGKKLQKPEFMPKYKLCKGFNESLCSYREKCKFQHFCSVPGCGSSSHGEVNHASN